MTKEIKESKYFRTALNGQTMLVVPFVTFSIYSFVTGEGRYYGAAIFALFLSVSLFRPEIKYLLKNDRRFLCYFVIFNCISAYSVFFHYLLPGLVGVGFSIIVGLYSVERYDLITKTNN
jgi:hypothetical protein